MGSFPWPLVVTTVLSSTFFDADCLLSGVVLLLLFENISPGVEFLVWLSELEESERATFCNNSVEWDWRLDLVIPLY